MTLKEKILDSMKQAMKAGEREKLSTLRLLTSEIKNAEISAKTDLNDTETEKLIASMVKKLKDANKEFEAAGRDDLVENNNAEIAILGEFLPEPMTEAELEKIVDEVFAEVNPEGKQDFGKVMPKVMALVSGKADGNMVREMIQKKLA